MIRNDGITNQGSSGPFHWEVASFRANIMLTVALIRNSKGQ